ncbi:MAG TPA: GntR family transcriptional regulator [Phototrophicaceae bacterium]|nr:GntR family transcriptional regulator [Phototrophicaceae bacterium]
MMTHAPTPVGGRPALRRALRDEVFDVLLEKIAGGQVEPDAPLGIDPLAAELGVSPTPVREALVQLEGTGLVVRTALRGYRVAPPLSREALDELFDARRIIEVGAARLAVGAPGLLPTLRRLHADHVTWAEELQRSAEEPPRAVLNEYLRADWAFHQAILEAASNRFLSQMAQHMSTHGQRLRQFLDTQHTDADLAVAEHAEILAAFETGEADAAVEAMSRHIDAVHARAVEDFGDGRQA